ncbi:hypothetical protein XELAEV_18015191mg [Xenopus laevis]|uniref:Uncharacterized protein n=1 Tax=Xenopus laevis TaxID=8355 RepID=A0A974DI24_XENLA|nr:hypothetical protein XELAEV_18015191mg [Xenopus laevis]
MKHLNIFNIKNSFEAPLAGILFTPRIKALLKGHVCNNASLEQYITIVLKIFKNIFIGLDLVAHRYYDKICYWHTQ